MCVTLFFGGIILVLNPHFITLWVGAEYYLGEVSNLLIVLIMGQLVMSRFEAQVQDLSLNIRKKVLIWLRVCFVKHWFRINLLLLLW